VFAVVLVVAESLPALSTFERRVVPAVDEFELSCPESVVSLIVPVTICGGTAGNRLSLKPGFKSLSLGSSSQSSADWEDPVNDQIECCPWWGLRHAPIGDDEVCQPLDGDGFSTHLNTTYHIG
jgi:hypothetical protein